MKKRLFGLLAMASVICATGCLKDEVLSQATGDEVTVTFTTELRTAPKTKAVGDDVNDINKLEVAVYDAAGNYLPDVEKKVSFVEFGENGTKKYSVNLVLVKGQTYQFAFWAQNSGYEAYVFDPSANTVTVDYEKVTANNRAADAFFANVESVEVNEAFTEYVTLKRPFAQVNFLTSEADFNNAMNAAFVPESQIVVDKVASSLNVLTGEVTVAENSQPVTFAKSSLLKKDADTYESTKIGEDTYYYVATAYVLPTVATGEDKVTATMTVMDDVDLVARDITVQRNYRTNIYGDLLTENGTFEVTVDPAFIDSDDEPYNEEVAQLAFADAAQNGGTFRLRRNFTIPQSDTGSGYEVTAGADGGEGMVIELDGFALNGSIVNNGTLTINDSKPTPEVVSNLNLTTKEGAKTTITAGYYSNKVNPGEGYKTEEVKDKPGTYEVVSASVTVSNWDEFAAALVDGNYIVLAKDIEYKDAKVYPFKNNVIVDLNNNTLVTGNMSSTWFDVSGSTSKFKNGTIAGKVYVKDKSDVTFDGVTFGGNIKFDSVTQGPLAVQGGSSVYAKNCKFIASGSSTPNIVSLESSGSGTVIFEDCTFNSSMNRFYANSLYGTASLQILNCSFNKAPTIEIHKNGSFDQLIFTGNTSSLGITIGLNSGNDRTKAEGLTTAEKTKVNFILENNSLSRSGVKIYYKDGPITYTNKFELP